MNPQTATKDHSLTVYQNAVQKTFAFLKSTNRLDELYTRAIPLPSNGGYLLPVCELHASDSQLIANLSKWREENSDSFPSQFTVTLEGTQKWLRHNVLDVEDRLLFLVTDAQGYHIGHLGLANALNDNMTAEIDNVVRGVKDRAPGIMSVAMEALLNWAEDFLAPKEIYLRVFSDNQHAIDFYTRLNFVSDKELPLRKHVEGNAVRFLDREANDTAPADKSFLRMVYRPATSFKPSSMILTAGPLISSRETSYTFDAARNGWNSNWSGYLNRLQKSFADYIGVKYALPVASGTGSLHIAVVALGIGPGDEVIVPDLTWVATANAVAYAGATPVFADVDPDSWCLDPESFESLITERTKAVMPVHLYGHPARMDRIMEIARRHNLHVIEDAAPALGSEFQDQRVGKFGDFSIFSFQGAKLLVSGEGGMLLTNDDELYEKAYHVWHIGSVNGTFWIDSLGLKYKMSNVQAAVALGQLEHVDQMVEAKRRIFSWYADYLEGVPGIKLNYEQPWARSNCWMPSIVLSSDVKMGRDELRDELKKRNIDTRPLFPAISQYPYWKPTPQVQPNAKWLGDNGINLPGGVKLRRPQIEYIAQNIREILEHAV